MRAGLVEPGGHAAPVLARRSRRPRRAWAAASSDADLAQQRDQLSAAAVGQGVHLDGQPAAGADDGWVLSRGSCGAIMDDGRWTGVALGDLSSEEWAVLEPLLPAQPGRCGRWRDHRQVINAICCVSPSTWRPATRINSGQAADTVQR